MTTPERVRRRQRIETTLLALMLTFGGLAAFAFDRQDDKLNDCLLTYIATDSETTKVRSGLVSQESQATRDIIQRAFAAESREDWVAAYNDYRRALERIDEVRAENPVREFDRGVCE